MKTTALLVKTIKHDEDVETIPQTQLIWYTEDYYSSILELTNKHHTMLIDADWFWLMLIDFGWCWCWCWCWLMLLALLFMCFLRLLVWSFEKPHWLHLLQTGSERPSELNLVLGFCFLVSSESNEENGGNPTGCTCWSEALRGPLSPSSGAAGPGLRVTTNSDFIVGRPLTQCQVTCDSFPPSSSSLGIRLVMQSWVQISVFWS